MLICSYRGARRASLHVHRIHRHHLPGTSLPGFHHPELRLPEPGNGLHAIHQILHRGAVEQLRAMAGCAGSLHDQPPHQPVPIENPKFIRQRRLPFVEHEPDIEVPELLRLGELLEPVGTADLLVGDERDVEGAGGGEPGVAEAPDGLEVLDGEALVVLRAAGVDAARGGVAVGGEGRVEPLLGLRRDGVEVGVEEEGGEGGVGARPREEEERLGLARGEVERGGAEAERGGVGEEEGGGAGVVRGRVGGADAEVVLEATDLGGLELGEGACCWVRDDGREEEEDDGGEEAAAVAPPERRHREVGVWLQAFSFIFFHFFIFWRKK